MLGVRCEASLPFYGSGQRQRLQGQRGGSEMFSSDVTLFSVQMAGTPLNELDLQVQVLPTCVCEA